MDCFENRRHVRHSQHLTTSLYGRRGSVISSESLVTNLSLGGLCMHSPLNLNIGDPIRFKFPITQGRHVQGLGQVRWSRNLGFAKFYGLEIVRMGFFDRRRLNRYLVPQYLGIWDAADMSLQCAAIITAVLLFREFLRILQP